MSANEEPHAIRQPKQVARSRVNRWLWGAIAALLVMFVAGVLRAGVLLHGHDAKQALAVVEIVAVLISIAALLRWAILHEGGRSVGKSNAKEKAKDDGEHTSSAGT